MHFLKEVGVDCVQLTFFGLREMTDRYMGRKGLFDELLKATDMLIDNKISPRWQAFINQENKDEIVKLLHLSKELKLKERVEAFGGTFRFFVHVGSCDGENLKLYPVRINKGQVPDALIPYLMNYIVIYVANNYDIFFNFTHMKNEWKIGNLKEDPMDLLVERILSEDIPALKIAGGITVGELVARYGNPSSERLFEEDDYKMYLLNKHLGKGN